MNAGKKIDVLLVEDNDGDVLLTQEALRDAKIATQLSVVRDGEEAMQYLKKQGGFATASRPDIIILDLNLPRLNGSEVLREIRSDPALQKIPVIVLTSSAAESDVTEMYELCANCYVVKPIGFEKYMEAVQSINMFWMDTATLPASLT